MTSSTLEWKSDQTLAVGKGATVQQFIASRGADKLEINVAPWGEGQLKVNGREIARIDYAKDRRQAFRELDLVAGRYLSGDFVTTEKERRPSRIPSVKAKLLEGKKGLIVGIANDQSIAWGCAKAFHELGAQVAHGPADPLPVELGHRQVEHQRIELAGRGQEALSVALGLALRPGDVFAPLIRDSAGRLAFGEPILDAVRTYLGSPLGPMRARDGNIHRGRPKEGLLPMISHLGAMISVVNGALFARRLKGISGTVGAASIGDGAWARRCSSPVMKGSAC